MRSFYKTQSGRFLFREPTLEDLEIYKTLDPDCHFLQKLELIYTNNIVNGIEFSYLTRNDIVEISEPCLVFYSYSLIEYKNLYRTIYVINGNSFNNLESYEKMPIVKLLSLVEIHNKVQRDIEKSFNSS